VQNLMQIHVENPPKVLWFYDVRRMRQLEAASMKPSATLVAMTVVPVLDNLETLPVTVA